MKCQQTLAAESTVLCNRKGGFDGLLCASVFVVQGLARHQD
jgi:hypothetical protein